MLIGLSAAAQHYISPVRAMVKVQEKRGKTKIHKDMIVADPDTIYLSDTQIIIQSLEKIVIDAKVVIDNEDMKVWEGFDIDLPVKIYFFKKQRPNSILVNYYDFGVLFFLE